MSDTTLHTEKTSILGMPVEESREEWHRLANTYQCQMRCEFPTERKMTGALARTRTPTNQILTWQSPSVRYRRSTRHIRRDEIDSYLLLVCTTGAATVDRDAGSMNVRPGSAGLLSAAQPFDVTHSSGAGLAVLTIDRRKLEHRMDRRFDTASPLDLSTGFGLVVQELLHSILRACDVLSASQFDAAVDRLIELLCVLIDESTTTVGDRFGEIETAIRRYVREHAHDPELNADAIAGALGWSVRQIQLAMQRAGTTPRDLIREERLALAHERLISPSYRDTSITDLAYRCGFVSAGSFSTAFRQRFGVTPRDLRKTYF